MRAEVAEKLIRRLDPKLVCHCLAAKICSENRGYEKISLVFPGSVRFQSFFFFLPWTSAAWSSIIIYPENSIPCRNAAYLALCLWPTAKKSCTFHIRKEGDVRTRLVGGVVVNLDNRALCDITKRKVKHTLWILCASDETKGSSARDGNRK